MKYEAYFQDLTEREKQIVTFRFGLEDGEPKTFEEVAKVFGVTRSHPKTRFKVVRAQAI